MDKTKFFGASRRWVARMRRCLTVCLLGATLASEPSLADNQLTFCFNEWRPYAYMDDGVPSGISVELARSAARRAGYEPGFVELPWIRCLEAVRRGEQVDAVLDAAEREDFVQGPKSTNVYTNTFWVRESSAHQRFDPSILDEATLGLVRGYDYPESLLEDIARAEMRVEYARNDLANLRLLAAGRVGFIIGDHVGTRVMALREGLEVKPLKPDHSFDRLYISFSQKATHQQDAFDAALDAMMQDGTVDRIYRERLGITLSELLPD